MRTLQEITGAVRRDAPVTREGLSYTICAYDVLLTVMELDKDPVKLAEFFKAAESDQREYIGPANDPLNEEAREWYKTFIGVGEGELPWSALREFHELENQTKGEDKKF